MWKICGKCGKHKALWAFFRDKYGKFSLRAQCKECFTGRPLKSSKGCKHSKETRAKISAAMKGKTPSEETRAKLSAARKRRKNSEETRAKLLAANIGRKLSEETRNKISISKIEYWRKLNLPSDELKIEYGKNKEVSDWIRNNADAIDAEPRILSNKQIDNIGTHNPDYESYIEGVVHDPYNPELLLLLKEEAMEKGISIFDLIAEMEGRF